MEHTYRLVISCPDRVGIVAKVSNFLSTYNGWITEASHHSDTQSGWFFMRHEIKAESIPFGLEQFRTAFEPIAREFNMSWHIADSARPKRVILMCSKESHCLADLLYRWHSKDLNAEIVAVISNHDDLRRMVEWHDIPYHHIPVSKENKAEAFRHIEELFEHYETDVVVLARYMQILPEALCEKYAGKVINIHHSFLPSFAGARPYHQAYSRGVKLIGATCHYVTQDLDEGPIIEQDVVRVTHRDHVHDLKRLGAEVERSVLSRAVLWHAQDKVIRTGNTTIVF
ncbi:MAG: formyltetrahydrofolate deformylase [Alteromonadaceae bacterium]|nr:formyltetrahydrofolate deformylase [Alteromonadaceae bacterium]